MKPLSRVNPLTGRDVAVLGLGKSGAAVARALARRAPAALRVVEDRDTPQVRAQSAELRAYGVDVRIGADAVPRLLDDAHPDLVVTSPGVREEHPLLSAVLADGGEVWSEPELAVRLNDGRTRLVGVTGTNGKTTTTELLGACLRAPTAGNIGTPLVDVLGAADPPPLVVAELSSFQLRFTTALRTDVAVLLNVAPDHLDWHGSLDAYGAAKARVWANQQAHQTAVTNADDDGARAVVAAHPPPGRTVTFTLDVPDEGQVGIADGHVVARLGATVRVVAVDALASAAPHNLANVLAATAAALAAGADPAELAAPLARFRPGPHRLEHVATRGGVDFVNDSKATNPHAAAAALGSYPSVVWIAGGLDKGLDFAPLADLLTGRVRTAVTIGTSGPDIAALARRAGVDVVEAGDLAHAVPEAAARARPGDTVLLAPACASMDQFPDYAARGQAFRDAVAALGADDERDGTTVPGGADR